VKQKKSPVKNSQGTNISRYHPYSERSC